MTRRLTVAAAVLAAVVLAPRAARALHARSATTVLVHRAAR